MRKTTADKLRVPIPRTRPKGTGASQAPPGDASLTAYLDWLARQPLAELTRQTYGRRVRSFLVWLRGTPAGHGDPLRDPFARDYAVRDYKRYLKTSRKAAPASVNGALAAIDHLYRYLGLGPARARREDLPSTAPRALDPEEQRGVLRAVERSASPRDAAIALLLFYSGLRLGECAGLDLDDVAISARKGRVVVRSGKGDAYREIPLNAEVRQALEAWLVERARRHAGTEERALFLNRSGGRLSGRSIDHVLARIGAEAGLELSAHILRHTCCTNLVRAGNDLVLVAEIAGHRRLETTRRYSLPSGADREAAMEALRVEY